MLPFILLNQNTIECLVDIEVSLILIIITTILIQLHLSFQLQTRKNLTKLEMLRKRYIVVLAIVQPLVMGTIFILQIMRIKTEVVIQI